MNLISNFQKTPCGVIDHKDYAAQTENILDENTYSLGRQLVEDHAQKSSSVVLIYERKMKIMTNELEMIRSPSHRRYR